MSFCKEVKTELTTLRPSGCCKPSIVYGLLLFGRSFSFNKISSLPPDDPSLSHSLFLIGDYQPPTISL